jgi:hypothetical protein
MGRVDCRARLACLNRTRELSKKFFNFPCTCPILDLTHEARLLALMLDAMFQSSVSATKYSILTEKHCYRGVGLRGRRSIPSESHSRTEIIRAISDVDDAIIVRIVAFEERIEFLTCRVCALVTCAYRTWATLKSTFANVWVAADRTVMLWSVGIDVSPKFEQTGLIPLGRVGHYLSEEVLEPFCLCA